MDNGRNTLYAFVGGMFLGTLLGGGLTLLLAPKSGEETRHEIKEKAGEVYELGKQKAKEVYEEQRGKISEVINSDKEPAPVKTASAAK